jgi:ubiquitin thioesterase OTU1
LDEAKAVVAVARNARQFTDVKRFELRCLACQTPLKGQEDARAHAKETGHSNFGEV